MAISPAQQSITVSLSNQTGQPETTGNNEEMDYARHHADLVPGQQSGKKTFLEKVAELQAFHARQGYWPSQNDDEKLFNFCRAVRHARKHPSKQNSTSLDEDRIASLDAIGFDWNPQERRSPLGPPFMLGDMLLDGFEVTDLPATPDVLPGPADLPVTERDVLCGRDLASRNHAGNCWFLKLLEELRPAYRATRARREKAAMVRVAIASARRHGGRFLRRAVDAAGNSQLREMGDATARAWARQRLGRGARAALAETADEELELLLGHDVDECKLAMELDSYFDECHATRPGRRQRRGGRGRRSPPPRADDATQVPSSLPAVKAPKATNVEQAGEEEKDVAGQQFAKQPFLEKVAELQAFHARNGYWPSQNDDERLFNFCRAVRHKHPSKQNSTSLDKDRIASLDAIGFNWNPQERRSPSGLPFVLRDVLLDGSEVADLPATPDVLPGPADLPVTECDVLCGREHASRNHAGNCWFSKLLDKLRVTYRATQSRRKKAALAHLAIVRVRRHGGRFLRRPPGTPLREMGDVAARAWAMKRLGQGARAVSVAAAQDWAPQEQGVQVVCDIRIGDGGALGATCAYPARGMSPLPIHWMPGDKPPAECDFEGFDFEGFDFEGAVAGGRGGLPARPGTSQPVASLDLSPLGAARDADEYQARREAMAPAKCSFKSFDFDGMAAGDSGEGACTTVGAPDVSDAVTGAFQPTAPASLPVACKISLGSESWGVQPNSLHTSPPPKNGQGCCFVSPITTPKDLSTRDVRETQGHILSDVTPLKRARVDKKCCQTVPLIKHLPPSRSTLTRYPVPPAQPTPHLHVPQGDFYVSNFQKIQRSAVLGSTDLSKEIRLVQGHGHCLSSFSQKENASNRRGHPENGAGRHDLHSFQGMKQQTKETDARQEHERSAAFRELRRLDVPGDPSTTVALAAPATTLEKSDTQDKGAKKSGLCRTMATGSLNSLAASAVANNRGKDGTRVELTEWKVTTEKMVATATARGASTTSLSKPLCSPLPNVGTATVSAKVTPPALVTNTNRTTRPLGFATPNISKEGVDTTLETLVSIASKKSSLWKASPFTAAIVVVTKKK